MQASRQAGDALCATLSAAGRTCRRALLAESEVVGGSARAAVEGTCRAVVTMGHIAGHAQSRGSGVSLKGALIDTGALVQLQSPRASHTLSRTEAGQAEEVGTGLTSGGSRRVGGSGTGGQTGIRGGVEQVSRAATETVGAAA